MGTEEVEGGGGGGGSAGSWLMYRPAGGKGEF